MDEKGWLKLALGLDDDLDRFANAHSASSWKQFVKEDPEQWLETFLRLMNDPGVTALFNLNGVNVWAGVTRASAGRGGATDWELLQIRQNPVWWPRIEWFKGDRNVPNPFG